MVAAFPSSSWLGRLFTWSRWRFKSRSVLPSLVLGWVCPTSSKSRGRVSAGQLPVSSFPHVLPPRPCVECVRARSGRSHEVSCFRARIRKLASSPSMVRELSRLVTSWAILMSARAVSRTLPGVRRSLIALGRALRPVRTIFSGTRARLCWAIAVIVSAL